MIRFRYYIFLIFCILYSKHTYAYLDMGSATVIIQSIIAVIVGGFVALNMYRIKVKLFIKKIILKFQKKILKK